MKNPHNYQMYAPEEVNKKDTVAKCRWTKIMLSHWLMVLGGNLDKPPQIQYKYK